MIARPVNFPSPFTGRTHDLLTQVNEMTVKHRGSDAKYTEKLDRILASCDGNPVTVGRERLLYCGFRPVYMDGTEVIIVDPGYFVSRWDLPEKFRQDVIWYVSPYLPQHVTLPYALLRRIAVMAVQSLPVQFGGDLRCTVLFHGIWPWSSQYQNRLGA